MKVLNYEELEEFFIEMGGKIKYTKKYTEFSIGSLKQRAIRFPEKVLRSVISEYLEFNNSGNNETLR